MMAVLELYGIVLGLGVPLTWLLWGHLSPLAIKVAGASFFAVLSGYAAFLTTAYVYGFASEWRKHWKP